MSDLPPTQASEKRRRHEGADAAAGAPAPVTVGRYEIERELARGGMGVVYRARDTRLDRIVALKALPLHVAADPEARDRFEREARHLAALEHPHVAAIYGIEDAPGGSFLVLQHVEGRSLAQVLRSGPLSPAAAIDLAAQVASGVAAAHGRGIIHCDLKPGNVMVTPGGGARIVDFGIALRFRRAGEGRGDDDARESMGTPAYMSPEQIEGRPLDPRTDTWSFACTLMEMLVGAPVFEARTPRQLAELILTVPPDWRRLPPVTPQRLRELLERCLKKDRDERPATMDEVLRELETLQAASQADGEAQVPARAPLPLPVSSFVGRESELDAVGALLLGDARLVTLTGAAGCGKTRLALEAARRAGERLADGAWFAALAPLAEPGLVAPTVAAAVHARRDAGTAEDALVATLRDKRGLLLLDNCEHVLGEAARVAELVLSTCPGVQVACTSREPLGVSGETTWRVPSMSIAGDRPDALALLLQRAREARPGFEPDPEERRALATLVERLDGIPLAIELAAARLRMMTPAQVVERLSDRFRLLTGGSRTALERHQTLKAALDWSYDLLEPDEQRCLRELSVFAGGFRLEEAAAVATGDEFEVLDRVGSLVNKSLVQAESQARAAPRYRLLESVRQHAAALLHQAGEARAARDAHLRAYLAWMESACRALGSAEAVPLAVFEADHDNVRAALEWSLADPASLPRALRLAALAVPFWDHAMCWREGRAWLTRAIESPGAPLEGAPIAAVMAGLGRMEAHLGAQAEAEDHLSRALDLADAASDVATSCTARLGLGLVATQKGRLQDAVAIGARVLDDARAAGLPWLQMEALQLLGASERDRGELAASRLHGEEALRIARGRGATREEARALRMLGTICRDEMRLDEAEERISSALRMHEARGERREILPALVDLAHVARMRKDDARARALFSRVEAAARETGERRLQALALANLGLIEGEMGLEDQARATLLRALRLARDGNVRLQVASFLVAIAAGLHDEDPARAAAILGSVEALRAQAGRKLAGIEASSQQVLVDLLRAALGEGFDAAWEAGAARSIEDVADDFLGAP